MEALNTKISQPYQFWPQTLIALFKICGFYGSARSTGFQAKSSFSLYPRCSLKSLLSQIFLQARPNHVEMCKPAEGHWAKLPDNLALFPFACSEPCLSLSNLPWVLINPIWQDSSVLVLFLYLDYPLIPNSVLWLHDSTFLQDEPSPSPLRAV